MNNSALISTAMLSAIFEEKNQDNIGLLIPFIIKIISEDNTSNEDFIVEKMEKDYSFSNFPHAILKIIINRLKKQEIIKQENGKYVFLIDVNGIIREFDSRRTESIKQIDEVCKSLMSYFKDNTDIKMTYSDCRNSLANFLNENGYLLYEDMINSTRLNKIKDTITYHIGRFVYEHIEKNDYIFSYLKNIIEGSLIANALYINVNSDIKSSFNKLSVFFDTPFMLRVLDLKLPEENKSALELVNMLKQLNIKIKCFRHNYDEIENILEEFIKNYGKIQEKTLENLIIKNFSESDVRNLLNSLDSLFDNLGIEIVDTPPYEPQKYKYVIDEKKLFENLSKKYVKKDTNPKVIENDVKSVSAIMRLRNGKEYRKLEDCNAIFITTNRDIKNETIKLLNLDTNFKISPVMSDLDLTAVVWLKSMINNDNVPELKLTENAMTAIKPTSALRKKFNQSLKNIKSTNSSVNAETLYNLLCSNYYVEDLMFNVNGDIRKINPNVLISTYEDTLKRNKILTDKEEKLSKQNQDLVNQLIQKEENDKIHRNRIKNKYTKKESSAVSIIKRIEFISKYLICFVLFYLAYKYSNSNSVNSIIKWFLFLASIYCLLCNFIPLSLFSLLDFVFNKLNAIIFIKLNNYYSSKAQKEIDEIFDTE